MFRFEVPFALFFFPGTALPELLRGRKVLHGGLGPCAAALVRAERPRAAQDLRGAAPKRGRRGVGEERRGREGLSSSTKKSLESPCGSLGKCRT